MRGNIQSATSLSLVSNTTDGIALFCSGTTNIFNVNNNQINCNRSIVAANSVAGGDMSFTLRNITAGNAMINLQTNNPVNTSKIYANSNGAMGFDIPGNGFYFNKNIILDGSSAGDLDITIRNNAVGPAKLRLQSNASLSGNTVLNTESNGIFSLYNNGIISCQAKSNGVFQVMNNNALNKMLVMHEMDASETASSAFNFYGFGVNTNTLRYQVPSLTNNHRFFCGTTQSYLITNGAGSSGSDARWKTEIQDITNGLNKVKQLQGKTFKYQNCQGRQMGLIAQDVKPIVSEVVIEDDEGYNYLAYDRLVALLIEALKELEQRVSTLENNI
jgi:hypothetical protein